MRYHTFDLTVSVTGVPHEYLLSAQSSTQGEAAGRTKIDPSSAPLADLLASLGNATISSANLQALGAALYQSLFAGEIGMLLNRALGETIGNEALGLRLRLRINPPELAALPWEFLYSPERRLFLAASVETPLSRYLNLSEPVRQLAVPEKINLLVVITQNSGLDTTAERKALEKVASQLRDRLTIDFLEGEATSAAIRAALRQKDYHILHYAGHGAFKNDEAFLYLDHEEKLTEPISAEQFAHFFTDYTSTRLVFLNACQGATRSSHQALAGVAPQLVLRGVPAVVAMQEKIDNDDAILFATEFYAELCRQAGDGQVEVAISRARKALLQERSASAVFGNPVLYLRAEDGRLWETKKTAPPPLIKEKKPVLERWQTWVAFISAIVVLLGAISDLPQKMLQAYHAVRESLAPSCQFNGHVFDKKGKPVVGAEVFVQGQKGSGVTDVNGEFNFSVQNKCGEPVQVFINKDGIVQDVGSQTLPGPVTLTFEGQP
ncbi:CHAT domain-containing protein [candidate division KSB1 bacterium]|nr:CHAT domain-containing protein [candidate division KSB1 bacterium]